MGRGAQGHALLAVIVTVDVVLIGTLLSVVVTVVVDEGETPSKRHVSLEIGDCIIAELHEARMSHNSGSCKDSLGVTVVVIVVEDAM